MVKYDVKIVKWINRRIRFAPVGEGGFSMSHSWSKTRKILEEEMLCESLKGRVQYFLTQYHGAHDHHGRFCIRVDGKEYVHANPFNERYSFEEEKRIKAEQHVPRREWTSSRFLYDEENRIIEDQVYAQMVHDNKMEIYHVTSAIEEYLQSDIQTALASSNEMIRLLAVLDRRVGKRTLEKLKDEVDKQPEWLKKFYLLRLEAEGIM